MCFTPEGTAVHVICGKNPSGHLILVTVYIPTTPKWRGEFRGIPGTVYTIDDTES